MKLRPAPTIIAAFLLALMLLAGVAAISFRSTLRMSADAKRVEHTHEVMAVIEKRQLRCSEPPRIPDHRQRSAFSN